MILDLGKFEAIMPQRGAWWSKITTSAIGSCLLVAVENRFADPKSLCHAAIELCATSF
jgi:hypothetical protein